MQWESLDPTKTGHQSPNAAVPEYFKLEYDIIYLLQKSFTDGGILFLFSRFVST